MLRDVHSCTHWLRLRNPPNPPSFGLAYEDAICQQRQMTSLCNPLVTIKHTTTKSNVVFAQGFEHCRQDDQPLRRSSQLCASCLSNICISPSSLRTFQMAKCKFFLNFLYSYFTLLSTRKSANFGFCENSTKTFNYKSIDT
jgi:hypothetical protein